jgi:hypothetical protein
MLQQLRYGRLENIQLAGPVAMARRRGWSVQVLGQCVPANVEVTRDSALEIGRAHV